MEEFIKLHFYGQANLYLSKIIEKQDYDILYSDIIDDEFWNLALLKNNEVDLEKVYTEVEKDMQKIDRNPQLYITSNNLNENLQNQLKENFECQYTDVWMALENLNEFPEYKSDLEISIDRVKEEEKEDFVETIMNGFSGDDPNDPYEALSDGYKVALRNSFQRNDGDYQVIHYLGKYKKENIANATAVWHKNKANIYSVTTSKKYQKRGVCKELMSTVVKDLSNLGVEKICLQTEERILSRANLQKYGISRIFSGKSVYKILKK